MFDLPETKFISRAEAAVVLGVTAKTLRDWERAKRGPELLRLSEKKAVYPTESLRDFIASARAGGAFK